MVMKPFRPSYYMFFFAVLDLTVHKVQLHFYHFELTDQKKHRINLFSHNL